MEESSAVNFQETSFWTLVKAVCKRWLFIGFLAIIGGIIACLYAFLAMPLTKDVYQISIYFNQTNVGSDKNISYYNDNNLANIKNYIASAEYKDNVYGVIAADTTIFPGLTGQKRKDEFKKCVKISDKPNVQIFVIDQDKPTADKILAAFAAQAKKHVNDMMESMKVQAESGEDVEVVGIVAVCGEPFTADPDETSITGYIGTKDRLMAVAVGVILGAVVGAGIAVCLYFFNNKINSSQMLSGIIAAPVYVDIKDKEGHYSTAPYGENSVRYGYILEKKTCKVISFLCPVKTESTAHVIQMQAESMKKYGYKVLVIEQNAKPQAELNAEIKEGMKGNDYILIDSAQADNYDCTLAGELCDGAVFVIDQKKTSLRDARHTNEIAQTAGIKPLSVFVTDRREDYIK